MRKITLLFLLLPFLGLSQIQIGEDIDGEAENDYSGNSVSLSSDGNIVAIGAGRNDGVNGSNSGHVRIYWNLNGVWTQIGEDIDGEAENDLSGHSVSLSSDGNIVAIGAGRNDGVNGSNSGHVRIYENLNGVWTQIGEDIEGEAENDKLGESVSLSSDGNIVAISAPSGLLGGVYTGKVRVFKNLGGVWTQVGQYIRTESESTHLSLSLSNDGNIVAIGRTDGLNGGTSEGCVTIWENQLGNWKEIGEINGGQAGLKAGQSISLSSDGSIIAIGLPNDLHDFGDPEPKDSSVRIYENLGGVWTLVGQEINTTDEEDILGSHVSLSGDGSVVSISISYFRKGKYVGIYKNLSNTWTQIGTVFDDIRVSSVNLSNDGGTIAIGSIFLSEEDKVNSGQVHIYDLSALLSTKSFNKDYFSYYPNPVKNELNISLKNGLKLNQVNIYNIQSQYLYSVKTSKIDVSNLANGMYFLEVETNQGKSAKKIVIE